MKLLCTPVFLLCLALLLLNDLFLKQAYGNWLTGKLSDFAGLFVFVIFWTALFPKRQKFIFVFTALFFIFWKSSLSESFIGSWNAIVPLRIARTVDATDLFALIVLLPAWKFARKEEFKFHLRVHPVLPVLLSAFAFMATSEDKTYRVQIDKKYELYGWYESLPEDVELRYKEKTVVPANVTRAGWNKDFIIVARGEVRKDTMIAYNYGGSYILGKAYPVHAQPDTVNYRHAYVQDSTGNWYVLDLHNLPEHLRPPIPEPSEYWIIEKNFFGGDDIFRYSTKADFQNGLRTLEVPDSLMFFWTAEK